MKNYVTLILCMAVALTISGCLAASGFSNADGATGTTGEMVTTIPSSFGGPEPLETVVWLPSTTVPETGTATVPNITGPEETVGNGLGDSIYDLYFDYAQDHKPTEAEIHMVTDAMPSADVIELLGKPHAGGPTSGLTSLAWQTDEGNWYYIVFISAGNAPDNISVMDRIFYYSVCSPAIYMDV